MRKNTDKIKRGVRDIDLIVYDFDGVMTDNRVLVFEDGMEAVFCNRSDGLAVQKIKDLGIEQIIISREENPVVQVRAKKLGIKALCNISDKKTALLNLCKSKKINLGKVAYIGNDITDIEAMRIVGLPIAPNDAHKKVKDIAGIVMKSRGGCGVVRELFERLEKENSK